MTFNEYNKCFYHPDTSAVAVCDSCFRYVCSNDIRLYKKKIYGLLSSQSSAFRYCIACNSQKLKNDTKNALYGFVIIGLFIIMMFMTIKYSSTGQILTMLLYFIVLFALLVTPLLNLYRNSKRAEKEFDYLSCLGSLK